MDNYPDGYNEHRSNVIEMRHARTDKKRREIVDLSDKITKELSAGEMTFLGKEMVLILKSIQADIDKNNYASLFKEANELCDISEEIGRFHQEVYEILELSEALKIESEEYFDDSY